MRLGEVDQALIAFDYAWQCPGWRKFADVVLQLRLIELRSTVALRVGDYDKAKITFQDALRILDDGHKVKIAAATIYRCALSCLTYKQPQIAKELLLLIQDIDSSPDEQCQRNRALASAIAELNGISEAISLLGKLPLDSSSPREFAMSVALRARLTAKINADTSLVVQGTIKKFVNM